MILVLSNLGEKALIRQYIFSKVLFAIENWFTRIHSAHIRQDLISLERWICVIIFSLPQACVLLAELLAMQLAMVHCVTEELKGRILIFSDSRSAVLALRSKQTAVNNVLMTQMTIQEAIKSGRNRGVSIEVAWIKAHQATLFGNEEADKCAKQAALDHYLPSYSLPFTKEQLKKEICIVNSIDLGEIYFKHKSGQTFKQFFPYLKKVEEMKPTFNKYTLRIYSGHGAFNFDAHKYFPRKISLLCKCNQTQDIEHLLIRCCFTLAECTKELEDSGVAEQIKNNVPWDQICLLPPIHLYIKVAARRILGITGKILDESDPHGDFSFR